MRLLLSEKIADTVCNIYSQQEEKSKERMSCLSHKEVESISCLIFGCYACPALKRSSILCQVCMSHISAAGIELQIGNYWSDTECAKMKIKISDYQLSIAQANKGR